MNRDVDVIVREVGPRDGLQLVKTVLPTETKLAWIKAEKEAGMVEFEVCSFVPPKVIPQFADARAVAGGALEIPGIRVMALTPNIKGAEIGFEVGVHVLNYVLSVSKTHNEANVRRSREHSIADFAEIVRMRNADPALKDIKIGCGLATALGCTLEGNVPEDETLRVLEQVLEAGVEEVMLPDTVGYAHPSQVHVLNQRRWSQVQGLEDGSDRMLALIWRAVEHIFVAHQRISLAMVTKRQNSLIAPVPPPQRLFVTGQALPTLRAR